METAQTQHTEAPKPKRLVWAPQPGPQHALVTCPVAEVFFGGARGGGKTDGVLGKWAIKVQRYGRHVNAVMFRQEMPQADDLWERACDIFGPLGAKPLEHKKTFRFRNGARIRLRPLESVKDATKYQGQNLSDAAVEEVGNYADPAPVDRLWGAIRSAHGVPGQLVLTGNPGGPGQQWVAQRYVHPHPTGMKVLNRKLPNGENHQFVYIPSRVQDNRALLEADPGYINRLYLVGSPELVRAWLEGDWNAIEGAFFPEFSAAKHVIAPMALPAHWTRILAGDWGSARPFSFGWYAISDGTLPQFPRGAMVKYREWYGVAKDGSGAIKPNVGLKLDATTVGNYLRRLCAGETYEKAVIDPATFNEDGGPSIAERIIHAAGVPFFRADNRRVARAGAQGGWDHLRQRLVGEEERPMIYFFSTCVHTIRTIPAMQHDQLNAEDMDSDGEDHAPDETRYACMARPWVKDLPENRQKLVPFTQEWLEYEENDGRARVRYK